MGKMHRSDNNRSQNELMRLHLSHHKQEIAVGLYCYGVNISTFLLYDDIITSWEIYFSMLFY